MPVHSEPAANPTADQLGGALGGSIDAVSAVSEVTRRLLTTSPAMPSSPATDSRPNGSLL